MARSSALILSPNPQACEQRRQLRFRLLGLKRRERDVVVRRVEVGEEEDVEELELVDGDLLLDGKAKHVDVAVHVVRAGDLGAQNGTRVGIVNDLARGVGVVVLDEGGLLATGDGGRLYLDARAFGGGLGEAGRYHLEVVNANAAGSLYARRFECGATNVVAGNDAATYGVGRECDVAGLAVERVVEDGGAVAHGVHVGNAGLLMTIDQDGTICEELHPRVLNEFVVRAEADAHAHHVHVVRSLVGDELGYLAVCALEAVYALTVMRLDAVIGEVLGHALAELGVEVVCHAGGRHIDEEGVTAVALEGLGEFHADVAGTDDGDGLDGRVLEFVDDFLGILEELDLLNVFEVAALEARKDGERSRCEDELIVGLLVCNAVLVFCVHDFGVEVDVLDGALHVYGAALCLELLLGLVEEPVGAANLVANPQGHAAAQEADVRVGIEGNHLVALVVVQNGVDGGGACVVGADDDDLAHGNPSPNANTSPPSSTRGRQSWL